MLDLRDRDGGITLRVRVRPRARRTGLLGQRGEAILIGVAAAPERGRANRELVEALADLLGLGRSQVDILSGHTHPEKVVRCLGIDAAEARRRLGV